jgi:hypothetical protein
MRVLLPAVPVKQKAMRALSQEEGRRSGAAGFR